jgi:hypothetical protein
MSEVTLNPAATQPAINDANGPASRAQPQAAPPPSDQQTAASTTPTDSVELSAAAQSRTASPSGGPPLSDSDAQQASANLRQQLGIYGLTASLSQNQSVLSLLRRPG